MAWIGRDLLSDRRAVRPNSGRDSQVRLEDTIESLAS